MSLSEDMAHTRARDDFHGSATHPCSKGDLCMGRRRREGGREGGRGGGREGGRGESEEGRREQAKLIHIGHLYTHKSHWSNGGHCLLLDVSNNVSSIAT